MNITDLTACELKEKLDKKELTVTEITKAYVDRINDKEKDVQSFVTTLTDEAIEKSKVIEEKIDNKDSFILVVSQSTCTHCATYKPKLEKISKKYNIDIFDIDYDLENKKTQKEFLEEFDLDGSTPITIFIKDGKQTNLFDRLEGDVSESKAIEKFKEMGFIEK